MNKRILVIAPHPDDEAYGCGGLIAKRTAAGDSVDIGLATLGQPWRQAAMRGRGKAPDQLVTRQREFAAAANILGEGIHVYYYASGAVPEMHLSTCSPLAITSWIDGLLADPYDEVYGPYRSFNSDHQIVHDCLVAALRNTHSFAYPKFVAWYEYPYATMSMEPIPGGRCYVDITGEPFKKKIQALECYKSQLREWPSQNSAEAVARLAMIRGMECGCESAELFYVQRMHY